MTRFLRVLGLAVPLFYMPPPLLADRAHDLASQAQNQKAVTGCKVAGLTTQSCHSKFPTGCTPSNRTYDAYLNFLKNQVPAADWTSTEALDGNSFKALEGKVPSGLTKDNHASLATNLADLGEGNIVTVIAYLYFVEDTGKGSASHPAVGETTNCTLRLPGSYDYHVGLGFDPKLAAQILKTKRQPVLGKPTQVDKTSVVAEITPHTRHPKWAFARVNALQGQQVKIVGQLMLDNLHWNTHDDCGLSGVKSACWRSTIWEVHPISQFSVCNLTGKVCDQSSPDSAWTSIDDLP